MREVRPGIHRVRKVKINKLDALKQDVISEKTQIQKDIEAKYERGKEAVGELQDFAKDVNAYVSILRERGIDVDYIRENADQIKTIFFAVLELLENGHKGFDEKATGKTKE